MSGSSSGTRANLAGVRRHRRALALLVTLTLVVVACTDDETSTSGEGGSGFFSQSPATTTERANDGSDSRERPLIVWERAGAGDQAGADRSGVDHGIMEVPLDHDDPDGESIELALYRRAASDPARRIGVLLVNPGGPGASGIEFAQMARLVFPSPLLERFDLIGFDPRGVGRSTQVVCGDGELMDRFTSADPVPPTPQEQAVVEAVIREFARACEQGSGWLLSHITTEASARDMDLIRAGLGEDQINYVGLSYGTYLGATYAELFPERIRAFVLDGGYSRSLGSADISEGQAIGFERSIERFLQWCRPERCQLAVDGDPSAALEETLESIRAQPLATRDPDGRDLTVGLAWTAVIVAMYSPGLWPQLDRGLDLARNRSDGSVLMALADLYNERSPGAEYGSLMYAFTAYSCMDREQLSGAEEQAVIDRILEVAPRVGPVFTSTPSPCEFWPFEAKGQVAPFSAPEAPPMIVIATTGDPATPYQWGVTLAAELESAQLLTVEGDAHTAFGSGIGCVDEILVAYLIELTMPPDGARCAS